MSTVQAVRDIYVGKNFKIASKGDQGELVISNGTLDVDKVGRVLISFLNKKKCYWVLPQDIKILKPVDLDTYIAKPVIKKLFPTAVNIPSSTVVSYYNFGKTLKTIRRSRHLSQMGLSKAVDASQASISTLEQRSEAPSGKVLRSLANALKTPEYVFLLNLEDCESFKLAKKYLVSLSSSVCEG